MSYIPDVKFVSYYHIRLPSSVDRYVRVIYNQFIDKYHLYFRYLQNTSTQNWDKQVHKSNWLQFILFSNWFSLLLGSKKIRHHGHDLGQFNYFWGMGIPMLKIRRSRDPLIFNMGIPILVSRHLYIETAPRLSVARAWAGWVLTL